MQRNDDLGTDSTADGDAMEAMNSGDLIGPGEAAKILGVRTQTIWRWGRSGIIPSIVMPNGRRMYSYRWAMDYVAGNWENSQPAISTRSTGEHVQMNLPWDE